MSDTYDTRSERFIITTRANSGLQPACRDRPRVCPIPTPIQSTHRITYLGLDGRRWGRTDTGSVPTCGLSAEWEWNVASCTVNLCCLCGMSPAAQSISIYLCGMPPAIARFIITTRANSGLQPACRDRPRVCPDTHPNSVYPPHNISRP